MWIDIKNNNAVMESYEAVVAARPEVQFSPMPDDDFIIPLGFVKVDDSGLPVFDSRVSRAERQPPTKEGERWVARWVIVNLSESEVLQKRTEYAANVRADRNRRLAASDWTQGKDIPDAVSAAWASYRQALRDVPQQAGFPQNVVWPVKPV